MRRVVVTGMGAIGPCGLNAPATWDAVRSGLWHDFHHAL